MLQLQQYNTIVNTHKLQRNIPILYLVNFMTGLLFTIPIWVAFEQRFLTYSQMAILESAAFLVTTIFEVPTGALADIIGRKKTIVLGFLIISFGYIFEGFSVTAAQMIIGIMVYAVGGALVSGADTALAYDTYKQLNKTDQFPKFIARGLIIYRVGIIIATFLGGYLYSVNPGIPYIARGLAVFLAIPLYFFIREPTIVNEKFSLVTYIQQTKDGVKQIVKDTHTKLLSLYYILVGGITWSCLYYFNNTFARDVGFTEIGQGQLYAGIYIVTTLIILYLTHKRTSLTRPVVYGGFLLLMTVGLLPGVFATTWTAPFLLTAIVLAGGSRFAILDSYVNEEFDSRHRATANSTLNMLVSIVVFLLIATSGKLQEIYSTKLIFSLLGIITLLFLLPTTVALLRISRHTKDAV